MDSVQEKSYLSYLYQTAYHKALNHVSSRKRSKKFLETVKKESEVIVSSVSDDRSSIIRSAFQRLKPKEALILELQFFQKLSYKEIAAVLEISVSAVDSKLVRAKRNLKKILSQEIKDQEVSNYRGGYYEQKIRL
jgi:RNA polymerase sigma-70 factor (ECF subfamily)